VAASVPNPSPHGYFRRWIEGSNFSLEANTPAVPGKDRFYVLVAGEACLGTSSFAAASAKYEGLCVAITHCVGTREQQLTHADLPTRLLGAQGLFRRNHEHAGAGALLARHGNERDRSTVAKARHRASLLQRRGQ
jgi:hypothetical protein